MAILATLLLFILALFQIALIFGAPWGHLAWGGAHKVLPTALRIASGSSIVVYGFIAVVLLERAGNLIFIGSQPLLDVLSWVVTAYFSLGILLNAVSRSRYERLLMTPLVTILAILSLIISLS